MATFCFIQWKGHQNLCVFVLNYTIHKTFWNFSMIMIINSFRIQYFENLYDNGDDDTNRK